MSLAMLAILLAPMAEAPVRQGAEFSLEFTVDGAYQSFHDVDVWGVGGGFAVGARAKQAFHGHLDLFAGETGAGLEVQQWRVGFSIVQGVGRIRLGAFLGHSLLIVERSTDPDDGLTTVAHHLEPILAFDVLEWEEGTRIFLRAQGGPSAFAVGSSEGEPGSGVAWSAKFSIGVGVF